MGPINLVISSFHPSSSTARCNFLVPTGVFTIISLHRLTRVRSGICKGGSFSKRYVALTSRISTTVHECNAFGRPIYKHVCTFRISNFNGTLYVSSTGMPDLLTTPCLNCYSFGSTVCRGAHGVV